MKSTIRKSTYEAIYRLLNRVSPIDGDCGQLCNAACCSCEEDSTKDDFELGIYLLPGEEKLFTGKEAWLDWQIEQAEDYDFPDSWFGNIHFIRCKTPPHCPRDMRPLQCRFFPLSPHLDFNGLLRLILCDVPLPYTCPLITREVPLNPDFIQATYTVWARLIKDPLILDLVKMLSGKFSTPKTLRSQQIKISNQKEQLRERAGKNGTFFSVQRAENPVS